MSAQWHAPFTPEQIEAIERWNGTMHPYTCNGGLPHREHRHDHAVALVTEPEGLRCPECGRVQTWTFAHEAAQETDPE